MLILTHPLECKFPRVPLYRDDIQAMLHAMAKVDKQISIRVDNTVFDSVEEFEANNLVVRPKLMVIKRSRPSVKITITPRMTWVETTNYDSNDRGLYETINDQMKSSSKWYHPSVILERFWASFIGIGIATIFSHAFGGWPPVFITWRLDPIYSVTAYGFLAVGLFGACLSLPQRHIRLDKGRHDAPLLERQAIVVTISALLTAASILSSRYWPPTQTGSGN